MKKILALLLALVLLGACAAPAMVEDESAVTTEEITTTPPTPREWLGVPQAYWTVLDNWYGSPRIGYALVDINGDGIEELLILQEFSPWGEHDEFIEILSIYTHRNDELVTLALFRPTSSGSGRIAEDGTIFMYREWRDVTTFSSHRLEPGATALTQLTGWSIETINIYGDVIAHRGTTPISLEEFWTAYRRYAQRYANQPNPMQFEFIPLG